MSAHHNARAVATLDVLPWKWIEADRAHGRQYAELEDGSLVWAPLVTVHKPPYPVRLFEPTDRCCLEDVVALGVRLCCTLPVGHAGVHSAGGLPYPDGSCYVFAEWGAQ